MDLIMTFMTFCIHSENVYLLILKNIPCYLRNHLLIHNNREKGNQSLSSSFFCSFRDLYWVASINKTFSGRTAEIMFEKYKVPALFLAKNAVCFPIYSIFHDAFPQTIRSLLLCCPCPHRLIIFWFFKVIQWNLDARFSRHLHQVVLHHLLLTGIRWSYTRYANCFADLATAYCFLEALEGRG